MSVLVLVHTLVLVLLSQSMGGECRKENNRRSQILRNVPNFNVKFKFHMSRENKIFKSFYACWVRRHSARHKTHLIVAPPATFIYSQLKNQNLSIIVCDEKRYCSQMMKVRNLLVLIRVWGKG